LHHAAKMTKATVLEALELHAAGWSIRALRRRYGTSPNYSHSR
jgi:hypothetical protein